MKSLHFISPLLLASAAIAQDFGPSTGDELASTITSNATDLAVNEFDVDDFGFVVQHPEYNEEWQAIDSFGLGVMHNSPEIEKRSGGEPNTGAARDWKREVAEIVLDERGNLVWPSTMTANLARSIKKRSKSYRTIITYYTGYDLKYPSCATKTSWSPTDKAWVGATTIGGWKGAPKCGEFIGMSKKKGGKAVPVRIVDSCAGCKGSHVDLTIGAFKQFLTLDEGMGTVYYRKIGKPKKNKWSTTKWGPRGKL